VFLARVTAQLSHAPRPCGRRGVETGARLKRFERTLRQLLCNLIIQDCAHGQGHDHLVALAEKRTDLGERLRRVVERDKEPHGAVVVGYDRFEAIHVGTPKTVFLLDLDRVRTAHDMGASGCVPRMTSECTERPPPIETGC